MAGGETPSSKAQKQENLQELAQVKVEKKWKKIESKQLTDKELQQKNIKEYNKVKSELMEQSDGEIEYFDKTWLQIRIDGKWWETIFPNWISKRNNEIKIVKNKTLYDKKWNAHGWVADSRVVLELYQWDFYVSTWTLKQKDRVQWTDKLKLKPSEVWEYLNAIKKRIIEWKKTIKTKFIELSVNEDKKEADNLIETIGEQTA